MPDHQRYESFRSFFGSRIEPENNEELKQSKTGTEGTAKKILRVPGDDYNVEKDRSGNWIEDFNKHDQSLYERYVHSTEDLRKKADGKYGKDSSSSSNSDEKELLHGEYQTSLSKTQEAQNTIRELNSEAAKWNDEESRILAKNARNKKILEIAEREIASSMRKAAEEVTLRISQRVEKERERNQMELESLLGQKRESENIENMPKHWGYEPFISFFGSRIDHEKNEEHKRAKTDGKEHVVNWIEGFHKKEKDSSSSSDSDEKERLHGEYETALRISQLEEKKGELLNQMELEPLVGRKTESEIQQEKEIETLKQELSNKILEMNRSRKEKENLLKQFNSLGRELNSTHNQLLELKKQLNCKRPELCDRAETLRKELEKRTVGHEEVPEEKKKLDLQVDGLYFEVNSLWDKENELEEELKNKTAERQKILEDNIKLDLQIEHLCPEIRTLYKTAGHLEMSSVRNQKYEVELGTVGKDEKPKEKLSVRVANANTEQLEDATEVVSLLKQTELLHSEKSQSESQMERSRQESEDLEKEISTLSNDLPYAEDEQEVVDDRMVACDEAQAQVTAEVNDIMTEFEADSVKLEEEFRSFVVSG